MSDDEPEYALEMPFLPVASKGGPYDDDAFVAGYSCGRLDGVLAAGDSVAGWFPIRSTVVDQVDLIAMRHGYVMETQEESDGWTLVQLRRVGQDGDQ